MNVCGECFTQNFTTIQQRTATLQFLFVLVWFLLKPPRNIYEFNPHYNFDLTNSLISKKNEDYRYFKVNKHPLSSCFFFYI